MIRKSKKKFAPTMFSATGELIAEEGVSAGCLIVSGGNNFVFSEPYDAFGPGVVFHQHLVRVGFTVCIMALAFKLRVTAMRCG